jgi:type I restriction enzyme S subunit
VLRATNINGAALNFADLVYVPERRVSQEQRIRRGDIILAMSSGSRDVVGKAALARDDWQGGFGAFCGVLRARPGVDARYIARFLQSAEYRWQIDSIATGTNINNLSKTTLKSIKLPIAPPRTQTRLAALLDAIDEKRNSGAGRHLVAAKRAVGRFRQSVLTAGCSGRLTAEWRELHADLEQSADELLRELRSTEVKSLHREASSETPFDLPETWRIATGADAFTFVTSGSRGWAKYYSDEGPAFLRVGNLDRHRLDLDLAAVQAVTPPASAESMRTPVQPGDVLI